MTDTSEFRPALLIDARNALYRAIFAMKADQRHQVKYHYFVAFLRLISNWVNQHQPETVHIFWDAPRPTVWRRKILATYKERPKSNTHDISTELSVTTAVAKAFFQHMNVRQYNKKTMEADDLIFAAVTMLHPRPCVIISTDSDMVQIPFVYPSCQVYNPVNKNMVDIPPFNPAMQKAITGDTSDNIKGYHGIGPKKSLLLLEDPLKLQEFLSVNDKTIFYRNLLLIDLSLNPKLLANKIYVQKKLCEPVNFDDGVLKGLVTQHRVNGLLTEYVDLIPRFQKLV